MQLKMFCLAVASSRIGAAPENLKRGRKSKEMPGNKYKKCVPQEIRYDKAAHMPERVNSLRCAHCSTTKEVHRTIWQCSICNVGLCLNKDRNCFKLFHTK